MQSRRSAISREQQNLSRLATAAVVLFAFCSESFAQQQKEEAPKTKMEAFSGTIGAVSIKGYSEIGSVKGLRPITVTAMTFRDAKTGRETAGAVVEITEAKSYGPDVARSYVDIDEIPELLSGLTYISKADRAITSMPFYEAQYATRGGLKLTVFNDSQNQRSFSVHVGGPIGGKDSFLRIQQLTEVWDLLAKAKETIEHQSQSAK